MMADVLSSIVQAPSPAMEYADEPDREPEPELESPMPRQELQAVSGATEVGEPEPSEGEFTVFGDIKELEVIVRICGYLSSPKDLGHLACVSRGFGNKVLWPSAGACEQLVSMRSVVEESARRWVLARWTHLDEDCTAEGQSWLRQMQNVRLATRFDAKRNAGIGLFEDVPQEVRWPARGAAKTPGLLRTVFMKMKANESTVPFRADNVDGIAKWVWKHAKDQTGQKQLSETSGCGSEKRAVAKIAEQIRSLPPAKSIAKVVQDVEQEERSRPGGVVAHRHLNSKTAALPCCGSAVLPAGGRYFAEFTTLGAVFVGVVPADYDVYKGLLHKCHQEDGHCFLFTGTGARYPGPKLDESYATHMGPEPKPDSRGCKAMPAGCVEGWGYDWPGREEFSARRGNCFGLLLDSICGSMSVYLNGEQVGIMHESGLTGTYRWAICMQYRATVRIESAPVPFD